VFTARYELIPYIKQITFRLLKVKLKFPFDVTRDILTGNISLEIKKRLRKHVFKKN
jgi:hypothetical protein